MGTNNKNHINGYKEVSTGTLTSSLVSPGEIFLAALRLRAAAIICVHNHPSGDPAPSQEDVEITRRLKECGEMLAIRVLDHVILGAERYYSFSDRGLLWRILSIWYRNVAGSNSKLILYLVMSQAKRLGFFFAQIEKISFSWRPNPLRHIVHPVNWGPDPALQPISAWGAVGQKILVKVIEPDRGYFPVRAFFMAVTSDS
jgi:RadC-like JAB domain